jgi:hypothetical protein
MATQLLSPSHIAPVTPSEGGLHEVPPAGGGRRGRVRADWGGFIGLAMVGMLIAIALLGPLVITTNPETQRLGDRLLPPL